MSEEKEKKAGEKSFLSYFNLSSHYERKARLLPGLLCAMALLPVSATFSTPLEHWLELAATGVGLWAVCGVGISHLSSAAGNRLQRKLWPGWPHDAPTNQWLKPDDHTRSNQQKRLMYDAIKRLTKLDIDAAVQQGPQEIETSINDAVSRLRYRLRNSPHGDRLDAHNADYGFARNFAGLRPLWVGFLILSSAGCWIGYARFGSALMWCVVSTGLALFAIPLALCLPQYVRDRAWHYSESFFSAVLELDHAEQVPAHQTTQESTPKKPATVKSTRKQAKDAESD